MTAEIKTFMRSLLVVDDDPVQRLVIRSVAKKAGFEVEQASSTSEAEMALQLGAYDILILDLSLGAGTGIEILRHVAKLEHKPAILIASGHDDRTRDATMRFCRAVHLEAIGAMHKPLDLPRLRQVLGDFVTKPVSRGFAPQQKISAEVLTEAISSGQISPFYQPKICMKTGNLIGAEALARWTHAGKPVSPYYFCNLAEDMGLGHALTMKIFRAACSDVASWKWQPDMSVAVNVPPSVLSDLDFPDIVSDILAETGLPAERLTLEVVETGPTLHRIEIADVLTRLRIKGVTLAIDDFGTGFSSLESLLNLPFGELKIDMGFVRDCDRDPYAWQIVKASLMLAKEFGMKSVAEGIERTEIGERLTEAGCDIGQGYLYSMAIDGVKFRRMFDVERLIA